MAHSHETRDRVRQLYIEGMPLTGAAVTCGVSYDTAAHGNRRHSKRGTTGTHIVLLTGSETRELRNYPGSLLRIFQGKSLRPHAKSSPENSPQKTRHFFWHRWPMRTASFQKHSGGLIRNIRACRLRWTPSKPLSAICG